MGVATLLLLETLLFVGSFGSFFCGDSLYHLSQRSPSAISTLNRFTELDALGSYRPLTYVLFDHLLYPLSGLDPRGYQVVTRAIHAMTTVLVFLLLAGLVRSRAAALAGASWFGLHSVGFFLTYDATFIPDFTLGLFGAASLWCWARRAGGGGWAWQAASLTTLVCALLSKEAAIMLPAGMLAVSLAVSRRGGRSFQWPWSAGLLCVLYLAGQIWLRSGALFPNQPGPYALTLHPAALLPKLKYAAWLLNVPADWERRGWWEAPPALLILPVLVWMFLRLRAAWSARRNEALLCAAWALAALAPVLAISQAPMKHNVTVPVLALAVALAVALDAAGGWKRETAGLAAACLLASVALQARNDLRSSWPAAGSRVAEQSLAALRRLHPTLPQNATLYLAPSGVPGNIAWYFDGGGLFRLFYRDPTIQMRFADLGHRLPAGFARRSDVIILGFSQQEGRLFDVTSAYRRQATDTESQYLLPSFDPRLVSSIYAWRRSEMRDGQAAAVTWLARGPAMRRALTIMPGAAAPFVVGPLPKDARLLFGATTAGLRRYGAMGRLNWQSGDHATEIQRLFLDPGQNQQVWLDGEADLSAWAGQRGTLEIENFGDRSDDWIALSRLRIVSRSSPAYQVVETGGEPLPTQLLKYFNEAQSESRFSWIPSDLLYGKPVAPLWAERQGSRRRALAMAPGSTVHLTLPPGPESELAFGVSLHGPLRGGGVARLWLEQDGRRELLSEIRLTPEDAANWWDGLVLVQRDPRKPAALTLEAEGDRESDWILWSGLHLATPQNAGKYSYTPQAVLPPPSFLLLSRLADATLRFDTTEDYPRHDRFDTPTGQPYFFHWVRHPQPGRQALVTVAGTHLEWPLPALPADSSLQVAVTHPGTLGDGGLGRIYFDDGHRRELLFQAYVRPGMQNWISADIPLARWAGAAGRIILECQSGPRRNTVGDWLAWGPLRILPGKISSVAHETGRRHPAARSGALLGLLR